eukprot:4773572-Prymnesium_polylepis.1
MPVPHGTAGLGGKSVSKGERGMRESVHRRGRCIVGQRARTQLRRGVDVARARRRGSRWPSSCDANDRPGSGVGEG